MTIRLLFFWTQVKFIWHCTGLHQHPFTLAVLFRVPNSFLAAGRHVSLRVPLFYSLCLPPLSDVSSSPKIAFSEVSVWCHLSGKEPRMEVHPRHRKRGWGMLGWRCLEQSRSKILRKWWQSVVPVLSYVLISHCSEKGTFYFCPNHSIYEIV